MPLNEHNEKRTREYLDARMPHLNGIACPDCGEEMIDSSPNVTLDSDPPKKHVQCVACGYRGYRVA